MSDSIIIDETRVEGIVVREVLYAPGAVLDEHAHEETTLGILLAGAVTERRGDGEAQVQQPGDVFVRRSGMRHANQYSPAGARSIFLELEPDDSRANALSRADGLVQDELRSLAVQVPQAFWRARGAPLRRSVNALLSSAATLRNRTGPSWLDVAREVLAARSHCPLKLTDVARELGVHPVHFTQAFRARFRLTPGEFIRTHRVFNAVALASRGVPLADVAAACGFADQSHMTRMIGAMRGMPPGRLLRAAEQGKLQERRSSPGAAICR